MIRAKSPAVLGLWLALVATLFVGIAASAQTDDSTTYYVSSSSGDDSAAGTSPDAPWRTLAQASSHEFEPGDRILFRAGERFVGQLALGSSGRDGRPIRIGRYGEGKAPVLDGGSASGGGYSATIMIRNQHHIEIADLELVNTINLHRSGEPSDWSFGVHVINDQGGTLEHFRFARLIIHDVFAKSLTHGSESEFNDIVVSAIRFTTATNKPRAPPSYFRDILIEDNRISRTGRYGVLIGHGGTAAGRKDGHSRDPETGFNRDIVIRNNWFEDLGGSAVQLGGARFALIENNDFIRSGASVVPGRMAGRGSGAWVINSRDIVAQHNRSRHTRGYKDSYGMHVDFGNLNVLYQYNLSEDSEGGFVEILGNNRNVIWRYNISINDGLREKEGNTLWLSPWSPGMIASEEIYIYHNTVFVRSGLYPDFHFRAKGAHIWNNIFYASRESMIGETMKAELSGHGLELAGNLFFGRISRKFRELDSAIRIGDPLLAAPGSVVPDGYRIDSAGPAAGQALAIEHPRFPAAGKGVFADIAEIPQVDFFGTPLPRDGRTSIGAVEPVMR